ncbi:MAG TPA: endonuclease/exonuclease/phosphatase family protein [Oligoflexus sp.]|uniref:endonuclease/exonuclease/phosphatase family protein n=1 Tax=Oligoflexus sp. TaxID=1971216 RepID=UPI002D461964|nr:endonuclease/exonuclease/phosphatase family protein [Oligoflexus sp.]HYX32975.1 endonuclease/exonuclease/phosphatase family protein [Oligoflexus sp.]
MKVQTRCSRFGRHLIVPALLAPILLGAKPVTKTKAQPPSVPAPVFVMAYNVENLFDTEHDEGKDDWTYLPAAQKKTTAYRQRCAETSSSKQRTTECEEFDWTETQLKTKLERISKILISANQGQCADVLVLVEIENIKVLERLRTEFLGPCNYKPGILLEGGDRRGIDTAILSRFERTGEPVLHPVDLVSSRTKGEIRRTRDILEASLKLPNGDILTAFGIHFPAPYHPFSERLEAMETLNKAARKAAEKSHIVLAAGDFNTNAKEDSRLYRSIAAKDWQVSHLEGCHQCLGTHFFKKEESWSFLDSIMVWRGGQEQPQHQWTLDRDSVAVVKGFDFQTTPDGLPIGWESAAVPGQSDHLPITLQLKAVPRPKK